MSYLAGLDYSTTGIDLVLVDENDHRLATWTHYDLHGHDAFERTRYVGQLRTTLYSSLLWEDVIAVAIEEPFGGNPKMRQLIPKLKAVQGAIVAQLRPTLLAHPLSANQWRAGAGLPGNCSKETVLRWAQGELGHLRPHQRFPFTSWSQDAYDAYTLARALVPLLEHETTGEAAA